MNLLSTIELLYCLCFTLFIKVAHLYSFENFPNYSLVVVFGFLEQWQLVSYYSGIQKNLFSIPIVPTE